MTPIAGIKAIIELSKHSLSCYKEGDYKNNNLNVVFKHINNFEQNMNDISEEVRMAQNKYKLPDKMGTLNSLEQMPKYAKLMKDLLTQRERGQSGINQALSNLGDIISLMPYSLFLRLNLGELKPTQKELLLGVLAKHKSALAWKIADIKGHYGADITTRKVFESGFYCPTIFKDAARNIYAVSSLMDTAYWLSEHAKRTAWNEFSSSMASSIICLATVVLDHQVDDMTTHNTRYKSPAFTKKVFANMRRAGKGFSGVETPLFDLMLSKEARKEKEVKDFRVKRLRRVGDAQRVESSTDTILGTEEDASKQEEKIAAIDADEGITLVDVETDEEKNMAGYKMEFFKGMTYDAIRPIFKREYSKESFKKLRATKVSRSESTQEIPTDDPKEITKEDVQIMFEIILVLEFKDEALQVKYPIIDWEIHTEGLRKYWKIIRVGGITEAYQTFEDMLKGFDRQDLVALWNLVK
nr:DNA-directed DNA polymerase [Tanacetum cinerariifolium]